MANDFIIQAIEYARNNALMPEQVEGWTRADIIGVCGIPSSTPEEEDQFCAEIRAAVAFARANDIQLEYETKTRIDDLSGQAVAAEAANDPAFAAALDALGVKDESYAKIAASVKVIIKKPPLEKLP